MGRWGWCGRERCMRSPPTGWRAERLITAIPTTSFLQRMCRTTWHAGISPSTRWPITRSAACSTALAGSRTCVGELFAVSGSQPCVLQRTRCAFCAPCGLWRRWDFPWRDKQYLPHSKRRNSCRISPPSASGASCKSCWKRPLHLRPCRSVQRFGGSFFRNCSGGGRFSSRTCRQMLRCA